MNQPLQRPKKTNDRDNRQNNAHIQSSTSEATSNESENIVITMTNKINNLPSSSLSFYTIKELVEDTEKLGKHLVRDVKTTQIRKFLDAANRLRFHPDRKTNFTTAIKGELQLLRPKLAYAVGRQNEKNKGIKDLQ